MVELDPPVLVFEGDCFINNTYTRSIKLKKAYDGEIRYTLRMEGKNSDYLDIDIKT